MLLAELGAYRPDLLDRPRLIVGTKADVVQPEQLDEMCALLRESLAARWGLPADQSPTWTRLEQRAVELMIERTRVVLYRPAERTRDA